MWRIRSSDLMTDSYLTIYKGQTKAPRYRQMSQWREAFLYFDVNCNPRLKFHGAVTVENGDLGNQAADERFYSLSNVPL